METLIKSNDQIYISWIKSILNAHNIEYFTFDVTNKEIANLLNVQFQTTLLIFKDNKEVYRSIGETTKELIYDALKSSI